MNKQPTTPAPVVRKKNHSSFWAGDFFKRFNYNANDGENAYQLAAGKRSIANFVAISTGKRIPVIFNTGDSYTDSKRVVIGSEITTPNDFDVAVGLALHEASHIVYTSFDILKQLDYRITDEQFNKAEKLGFDRDKTKGIVKNLLNVVEDRRIDHLSFEASPGYREYYRKMYDKYFNAPEIDEGLKSSSFSEETLESYMFRIINLHNPNTRVKALKALPEIFKTIDLANIDRLENTADAFDVASNVFDIMLEAIDKEKQQKQNQKNKEQQKGEGQGEGGEGQPQEIDASELTPENTEVQIGNGDGTPTKIKGELSEAMKEKIREAMEKQKQFLDGEIEKKEVSEETAKQVDNVDESGTQIKPAGKEFSYDGSPIDVIVVNKVTKKLVDSKVSPVIHHYDSHTDAVKEGIAKGRILGKKLKIRSESRTTVFNRQKTGKIDKRMIPSLGFGSENVFYFKEVDEYKDANIHISLDASGSMSGMKFRQSIVNITAIVTACDMIKGLDVQVSLRSGVNFGNNYVPYMVKIFDSREDKLSKVKWLFPKLKTAGTTPEGLCFEAIVDDFIAGTHKTDSYFLNISDGMPTFTGTSRNGNHFSYDGGGSLDHTKEQVRQIERKGIKVLSYFVGDGGYWSRDDDFKRMYGKNAEFIDITNISQITRTINKLFLKK